ncbi:MAG: transcription antitermination factor NusB [Ignavibacteriales bacterium]|nr:transcription antitermination factor NusB [Ignavibacteriales bacterium]MCB9209001.1 transcription antitermination factor NusB [Ignavibacteriales bacterium]MCB9218077.1 transcription antitermination factor NusB [Ignavibacteriales bacterium]MCB9260466.1 transcription antitermination factor NusB [Ignavibacteriales bacterium]
MKSKRRKLREKVLQILYAYEMNGGGLSEIIEDQLQDITVKEDKEFCTGLINFVLAERKEIEDKIEKRLVNWDVTRIAVLDKLLLKIGIGELMFAVDIPPKVTINETIEIAKEYSTAKSGKFINGILDAILLDLKKEGKIKKVGRGLIENSLPKQAN